MDFRKKLAGAYAKYAERADGVTDGFLRFLRRNIAWISCALITLLSLVVRLSFLGYLSGDMKNALDPWLTFLKENGGFAALKYYPHFTPKECDYPVAYVELLAVLSYLPLDNATAIKLSSIAFDYLLALGGYFLTKECTGSRTRGAIAFCALCCMPTGILNSAVWGQCDQLYTCGAVWALYSAIRGRRNLCVFLVGLAFANKPQAVFFFPVLVWLFLTGKLRLRNLLMLPVGYVITFLPAYCFGTPFAAPFEMFFTQIGKYSNANYGAGNIYAFLEFSGIYGDLNKGAGVAFALCIVGVAAAALFCKGTEPTPNNCVLVTAFFALLTPFVLPHMHERYFYFAETMVLIFAVVSGRRFYLVPIVQFSGILCYTHFLFGGYVISSLGQDCVKLAAVLNAVVIGFVVADLFFGKPTLPEAERKG